MRFPFFALLVSLCISSVSHGAAFSTPLVDVVGPIDFIASGPGRTVAFDVGQKFSRIESVSLEIEARVFAEEFDVCSVGVDPPQCEHFVHLLGLLAIMDEQESEVPGIIFTHGLTFPAVNASGTEGFGTDTQAFDNPLVGWDFLLDGESSLTVGWNGIFSNPFGSINNFVEATGEIFAARLIIEGTPIPEPTTAYLLGLGLMFLSRANGREEKD